MGHFLRNPGTSRAEMQTGGTEGVGCGCSRRGPLCRHRAVGLGRGARWSREKGPRGRGFQPEGARDLDPGGAKPGASGDGGAGWPS